MADCCEHGNEPSNSIKGEEFVTYATIGFSRTPSCSMELVSLK
jgi:hypothetical protein